MPSFQKRPVVIQAEKFDGSNTFFLNEWSRGFRDVEPRKDENGLCIIAEVYDHLHDTWVGVHDNDWIIRGTKGEHYPVAADVFEDLYDAA